MRPFFILSLLLTTILCNSCDQPKPPALPNNEWQVITIHDGHYYSYLIKNHEDPSRVLSYHGGGFFSHDKKITIDTLFTQFTQPEKDSIYHIAKKLIEAPIKPKLFCTEYVGGIELGIKTSDQLIQTVQYSSTCDWTALSPETKQLANILQRHIRSLK